MVRMTLRSKNYANSAIGADLEKLTALDWTWTADRVWH